MHVRKCGHAQTTQAYRKACAMHTFLSYPINSMNYGGLKLKMAHILKHYCTNESESLMYAFRLNAGINK